MMQGPRVRNATGTGKTSPNPPAQPSTHEKMVAAAKRLGAGPVPPPHEGMMDSAVFQHRLQHIADQKKKVTEELIQRQMSDIQRLSKETALATLETEVLKGKLSTDLSTVEGHPDFMRRSGMTLEQLRAARKGFIKEHGLPASPAPYRFTEEGKAFVKDLKLKRQAENDVFRLRLVRARIRGRDDFFRQVGQDREAARRDGLDESSPAWPWQHLSEKDERNVADVKRVDALKQQSFLEQREQKRLAQERAGVLSGDLVTDPKTGLQIYSDPESRKAKTPPAKLVPKADDLIDAMIKGGKIALKHVLRQSGIETMKSFVDGEIQFEQGRQLRKAKALANEKLLKQQELDFQKREKKRLANKRAKPTTKF